MADPVRYCVTVKRPFVYQDINFGPPEVEGPKAGFPRYRVPPFIYEGSLSDGTPFKDLCATAEPEFEESP